MTSHRLILVDKLAIAIPLAFLTAPKQAGGFLRSERIELNLIPKPLPTHLLEYFPQCQYPRELSLKFRSGGRNDFSSSLLDAEKAEAWTRPMIVEQKQLKVGGYGILGIKQALNEDTKDRNMTLGAGFKDLKSLVEKSQELKNLAAKLKQMDDSQDPELKEIKASMANMGFTGGVTKDSAGKNFFPQLARELSDFIKPSLESNGGLLPMVDVFCMYNRARGGNLVSASDFKSACEQLESLCLPVRAKILPSGASALTLGSHAMDSLTKKVSEKVIECGNLSSKQVSELFSINDIISIECLKLAEQEGTLCRDEGLQGLHFYENLFKKCRV